MAEKFDPPVDIDLGTNPQQVVFNTVEDAKSWIEAEQAQWDNQRLDDQNLKAASPYCLQIVNHQRKKLREVAQQIEAAQSVPDHSVPSEDVINALDVFRNGEVLHSQSPVGRFAIERLEQASTPYETTVAIGFLAAAIKYPIRYAEFTNNKHFQNLDHAALHSGIALYRSVTGPNAEEVITKFDDYVREVHGSWERQLADYKNEHFDAVEAIKESKQAISDEHARQEQEFSDLKADYDKKFSAIESFYEEGLRAKAPVKYWKSKARAHTAVGIVLTVFFLAGSGFAASYGFTLGIQFSESVSSAAGTGLDDRAPTDVESGAVQRSTGNQSTMPFSSLVQIAFSKFLVLLVPGFFAVWALRIVLKVALSNLAVADDARHRVTMVETFLSMMEHSDKLDEADRILMLQSLFRPLPGSSDEDTGPPNWFDVMLQQVRKK